MLSRWISEVQLSFGLYNFRALGLKQISKIQGPQTERNAHNTGHFFYKLTSAIKKKIEIAYTTTSVSLNVSTRLTLLFVKKPNAIPHVITCALLRFCSQCSRQCHPLSIWPCNVHSHLPLQAFLFDIPTSSGASKCYLNLSESIFVS